MHRNINTILNSRLQYPLINKKDEEANNIAMNKVKQDKKREATAGHDGTWIAHPGLAPIALDAFDVVMPNDNQINATLENPMIMQEDLLKVPTGTITEQGFRDNIKVGIQYVEAWLSGNGCVPLYHLMEDAATAEISRSQLWQWIKNEVSMENGSKITEELFNIILKEELDAIKLEIGDNRFSNGKFDLASNLFKDMILKNDFDEFLTLPAYKYI